MRFFLLLFLLCISSIVVAAKWKTVHEAAMFGAPDDVQLHLASGVAIEAQDEDGMTPLLAAAMTNNTEVVAYLIEQGADVDAQDNENSTALMGACISSHEQLAKILLNAGASASIEDKDGLTAWALCEEVSPSLLELFDNAEYPK